MLIHLCALALLMTSEAFYFPGVAPTEYKKNEELSIKGVKITSIKTQLPYEYYSMPYCKVDTDKVRYSPENLGEILRGDRIVNTPYKIKVLQETICSKLCDQKLTKEQVKIIIDRVEMRYMVSMLLDNLPIAMAFVNVETKALQYDVGFPIGFEDNGNIYLNNHLDFTIRYHEVEDSTGEKLYRIVGFLVVSKSYASESLKSVKQPEGSLENCAIDERIAPKPLEIDSEPTISFTYGVTWEKSDLAWASRWDTYLKMSNVEIHWFAICNSIAIVLFLSGILALVLIRTLRRDIAKYNDDSDELDEALEETGWKLIHGDVFRPPQFNTILTAFLGSGLQIMCMVCIILVFAMFGMLSPASRGALMTAAIVLFMFMGLIAGYHAARMYRTMKGSHWKKAAVLTASIYPGTVFGIGFFINFFIWGRHSSGAIPFSTLLSLLCMWFGISLPLVLCGFYFGYRKQPYDIPVRTNQIPRQVPDQVWYLKPVYSALLAGILPFGAVFVELYFLLSAFWQNQFYYLFGFLFIVFIILVIACSEVAMVLTYFQLCGENYHWWWKSFHFAGSCAYYIFAYSVIYFFNTLDITEFTPSLMYFGYTFLMVFGFWLLTGTMGFYSTFFFIRKIYAAVKQD